MSSLHPSYMRGRARMVKRRIRLITVIHSHSDHVSIAAKYKLKLKRCVVEKRKMRVRRMDVKQLKSKRKELDTVLKNNNTPS